MNRAAYSIYTDKRPPRVAFFVNPKINENWFDSVYEYNFRKWGGKSNPVFFTDGKAIKEEWLQFLREYDPDVIYSMISLEKKLLDKMSNCVSPLFVKIDNDFQGYIRTSGEDFVSILPTLNNLKKLSFFDPDNRTTLVLFKIFEGCPEIIKKFISYNFGTYGDVDKKTGKLILDYHTNRAVKGCNVKEYAIKNIRELNDALLELGEYHTSHIYPIQFCSLPNVVRNVDWGTDNEKFYTIVGNTDKELMHFWNRNLQAPNWIRTKMHSLWVPKEMIIDKNIISGIKKWINKQVGYISNSNNNAGVKIISYSLSDKKLDEVCKEFHNGVFKPTIKEKLSMVPTPNYKERFYYFNSDNNKLDLHRAYTEKEQIAIKDVDVEQGLMGGEQFIADVSIQFRPERFTNYISGGTHWWQLPQKNNLSELFFKNKLSRINASGHFSILMKRNFYSSGLCNRDESNVEINIPTDRSVIYSYLWNQKDNIRISNINEGFIKSKYKYRRSEKGRYLDGVIELFSGLDNAYNYFEQRYWRKMFDLLSNYKPGREKANIEMMENKIKKIISKQSNNFITSPQGYSWLAKNMLNLVNQYAAKGKESSYKILLKEAKKETNEYNVKAKDNKIKFNEKNFKEEIDSLIEKNILLIGISPHCPFCGFRNWYPVEEISQNLKCKGCKSEFPIQAQEEWYYKLNSLVQAACSQHGLLPVILVLGDLQRFNRELFIFSPCIDVLNYGKNKIFTDLDIVCIRDRKFIIGEVKQTSSLFSKLDFNKMEKIAKTIKPNIVLFTAMDNPNKLIKENIERLQKSLKSYEIEVIWHQPSKYCFEPRPVR